MAALEIVWPQAIIIYCLKHNKSNSRSKLDDECLTAFKEMYGRSLEEDAAYSGGVVLAKFQWEYWIQQNNHNDGKLDLYTPHCWAFNL